MKRFEKIIANEEGSVIIVALLVLTIVTIIGISATSTSVLEQQIATNDKLHKITFCTAESGAYAISKLISSCMNENEEPSGTTTLTSTSDYNAYDSNKLVFTNVSDFWDLIMGYSASTLDNTKDATMNLDSGTVLIDVVRFSGSSAVAGGGAEFATGSEGAGVGSSGGVSMYFGVDSQGSAGRGSKLTLGVNYKKIVGVPGGL